MPDRYVELVAGAMSWSGGTFGGRGECVLAPNANMMTLDGTNTWVLREPDARRSIVIDPGPSIAAHLDAVAEAAGDVAVEQYVVSSKNRT